MDGWMDGHPYIGREKTECYACTRTFLCSRRSRRKKGCWGCVVDSGERESKKIWKKSEIELQKRKTKLEADLEVFSSLKKYAEKVEEREIGMDVVG